MKTYILYTSHKARMMVIGNVNACIREHTYPKCFVGRIIGSTGMFTHISNQIKLELRSETNQ